MLVGVEVDGRQHETAAVVAPVAYGAVVAAVVVAVVVIPMAVAGDLCSGSYAVSVGPTVVAAAVLVDQEMVMCWPIGNLVQIVVSLAIDYHEVSFDVEAVVVAAVEQRVLTFQDHESPAHHLAKVVNYH